MNRYDDDHVIALLRDAVPPVPDIPDRVTAVKQRAGHQRAMLWTQTIGAVASVLLVVGVAAAVATPGAGQRVQPTSRPIEALAAAFAGETSVRFEGRMTPLGTPNVPESGLSSKQLRRMLEAHAVGAVTRDGKLQIDGDLSLFTLLLEMGNVARDRTRDDAEDFHVRVVDGVTYRTPMGGEDMPPGKKWIRGVDVEADDLPATHLDRALKMLNAIAEDVRHVGGDTVRGTRVAEYELTIPAKYTRSKDLRVRFALDDEDRLRRVTSEFSLTAVLLGPISGDDAEFSDDSESSGWTEYPGATATAGGQPARPDLDPLMVRVEIELFGYGDRIEVVAPPGSEVVTEEELWDNDRPDDALTNCLESARSKEAATACYEASGIRLLDGEECTTAPDGSRACGMSAPVAPKPGDPPPFPTGSPRPARPRPAATTSPSP